ncbi:autophagy-related protein [Achlya hypogyna]|uniref:Autophagy-related protein n=1 Tax=Achlya hypogyna TaxID=1202772 RepID=A0A1V9ZGV1_ACHHY|nr:autophagy-related protein [Achlya hypogyna]
MSLGLKTTDPESQVLYVSFNQDATCISVGTRHGFFVYSCEPFGRSFHEASGGIGIAQMLFSTSLVVLVGAGEQDSWESQPAFSPRRLRVWNTKTNAAICDLNFVTAVLSVQLNRQRLVVVLERKIYIFDINSMQVLNTIDTAPNPKALCVLSPSDNGHLAFPTGTVPGEIVLYDANNLSVLNAIQAHRGTPVALALNSTGTLLATASDTGTILRVFDVPSGKKKATFRRGSYPAQVYCIAFNATSTLLCCSSDTGTVHIFSLSGAESTSGGSFVTFASIPASLNPLAADSKGQRASDAVLGTVGSYIPSSVSRIAEGTRDFAFVGHLALAALTTVARLRTARVPNLCAIHGPVEGSSRAQLLVATIDGFFYQYAFDVSVGGECQLERENILRDSSSEEITATYLT